MQLRNIGELNLLKEIRKRFSPVSQSEGSGVIVGIGDDAAVIAPQKENILVTTDMMNEGVHFDLSYASPLHIGFKLVSVNVSDIMAMGGVPAYLFLNIAVKKDADEDFFWKLYDGIGAAMDIYKLKLLGGDLCSAVNDMTLSAAVIGSAGKVITRGGASAGDRIYVTSNLGDSACGLEILKRLTPESKKTVKSEKLIPPHPPLGKGGGAGLLDDKVLSLTVDSSPVTLGWDTVEPLLRRHLMPVARDSCELLACATSMIDISDGLFIDLCRICDESKVGARIYLDRIPLSEEMRHAAEILGLDAVNLAASGGEDYELLFTAPPSHPIPPLLRGGAGGVKITCIGEITDKDRVVVDKNGREFMMEIGGYQHFGAA